MMNKDTTTLIYKEFVLSSNIHQKHLTDEKRKQVRQTIRYMANDDFLFW